MNPREEGRQFEEIFKKQCNMQGISVRKKPLSAKWNYGGGLQLIESELDFELIFETLFAFIDAKTFDRDTLPHKLIKEHQVKTALWYMDNKVTSGYVVWHRPSNSVVFYDGRQLASVNKGESLHWSQGEYLGGYEDFCLGNLFVRGTS